MEQLLIVSLWFFGITHVDTFLLLVAFCTDENYQIPEVVVGHYLGFSAGLAVALVGSFVAAQSLREYAFILGLVPLALGVWGIIRRRPSSAPASGIVTHGRGARTGVVTFAGIGLSGENIAVFIPFFVTLTAAELLLVTVLYIVAAGVVFVLAYVVARLTVVAGLPAWFENWAAPASLIVIGLYVLSAGWVAG